MSLFLYNTMLGKKVPFEPIDPQAVRMYVCGPTVYDFAHIGNARPVAVFDLLFRLLRHLYGEEHVFYARNITDIDDKIITRARDEKITVEALTERTTRYFHEDVDALGALRPTYEPRATEYVPNMLELIAALIAKGHAYEADQHVLFHVPSMPEYGKLAKRDREEMIAGARVEPASYKKDPADFTLWKPSAPDAPGWDSPYGRGRPGWHIECSAMSGALFGHSFDIHGGGIDLIFPHHENEIAQSLCACGGEYARFWMHNGFVRIEGEKMSKSTGNFLTVREILETQQVDGSAARLTLLRSHYRQPLDWTAAAVEETQTILRKRFAKIEHLSLDENHPVPESFLEPLKDDLNMPEAMTILHRLEGTELASALNFLGLKQPKTKAAIQGQISDDEIQSAIQQRDLAKKEKNFALADQLRKELAEKGVALEDTPQGVSFRRQ